MKFLKRFFGSFQKNPKTSIASVVALVTVGTEAYGKPEILLDPTTIAVISASIGTLFAADAKPAVEPDKDEPETPKVVAPTPTPGKMFIPTKL